MNKLIEFLIINGGSPEEVAETISGMVSEIGPGIIVVPTVYGTVQKKGNNWFVMVSVPKAS